MANRVTPGKTNRRKKKLNIRRLILLLVLIIVFVTASAGLGFAVGVLRNMSSWEPGDIRIDQSTFVYDKDGNTATTIHGAEDRIPVDFDDIPKQLREAFLASEDPRFYSHHGIDLRGFARAVVANFRYGFGAQGGSTLTQQLAKNAFIGSGEKVLKRKLQEAVIAIQLERKYTKDEIFGFYLNHSLFGSNAYGVKAAAKMYFGKDDLSELTLSENAMLAGLVQRPNYWSPFKDAERAKTRRAYVLGRMVIQGYISQAQADAANAEDFQLAESGVSRQDKYPYFIDHVIEEASNLLEEKGIDSMELYTGGLKVYTTLDPQIQSRMEEVYADPANFPESAKDQLVESAMVVLDHQTGGIMGVIGGREYTVKRGLNRATSDLMKRQPGSAIKPIAVYAPAIENGYNPASVLDDVPVSFPSVPKPYAPVNFDGRYRGLVTMREAVQNSMNIPAVQMLNTIGVQEGYNFAKKLGLPLTNDDQNLSLALGGLTRGVSPLAIAGAYAAFANGGVRIEPYAVIRITDRAGKVLVDNKSQQEVVMSEQTAYLITSMLQTVVKAGTGTQAQMGRPVAGKTGTTQLPPNLAKKNLIGNKDAWFAGYTPELTAVVWMGYDQTDENHYLKKVYGGWFPARIWKAVISDALKEVPSKDFKRPSGIVSVPVDKKSGLIPSELTPKSYILGGKTINNIVEELFNKSSVPKEVSQAWAEVQVCAETGQLPSIGCPDIVTRVFLMRPEIADGAAKQPEDATLAAPTQVCTIHGPAVPTTGEQGTTPYITLDAEVSKPNHPRVTLSWKLNNDNQSHIYSVLRWTAANPNRSNIGVTPDQSYEDLGAEPGQTYYYQVVIVDPDSATTFSSNVAEIQVPDSEGRD
ncbi:MAG: PBP1A family penicillin-binding protein [Bacillota bacterium]